MTSLKSALLALAFVSFAAPAVMAGENAAVKEELAVAAASAEATEQAVEAAEAAAETPAK